MSGRGANSDVCRTGGKASCPGTSSPPVPNGEGENNDAGIGWIDPRGFRRLAAILRR
jgi:hypothetical protein